MQSAFVRSCVLRKKALSPSCGLTNNRTGLESHAESLIPAMYSTMIAGKAKRTALVVK